MFNKYRQYITKTTKKVILQLSVGLYGMAIIGCLICLYFGAPIDIYELIYLFLHQTFFIIFGTLLFIELHFH